MPSQIPIFDPVFVCNSIVGVVAVGLEKFVPSGI
jgi:hypothetical protein